LCVPNRDLFVSLNFASLALVTDLSFHHHSLIGALRARQRHLIRAFGDVRSAVISDPTEAKGVKYAIPIHWT